MKMAVRVSDADFVAACIATKSIKELAAKTGLAESTCSARRVTLRKANWPIPEYERGVKTGTTRKDHKPTPEQLAALAAATGKTVEDLQLESVKIVTTMQERSEKIKAGQAAARNAEVAPS